jgi:TRAP transporter TAXI family solute receptor
MPNSAISTMLIRAVAAGCAAWLIGSTGAAAQTYGFATMQPGTLNHTTGSAIAKVLKEKVGINTVIQPTAGESVLIPLVARGEAEIGIANIFEVEGAKEAAKDLRLIGSIQQLRGAYFVRKDSGMTTMADLKGKRVTFGYSAMKTIDPLARAMLITGGLTEKDIKPVLVPNVIRSAEEFASGNADMFFFAFGAAKVREVDATVGGLRVLEVPEAGMAEAKKILPGGYLTMAQPSPFYVGVEKPMNVYTWDNMLFSNTKVPDDVIYKIIDAMVKNKDDMVTVQPALREFTAAGLYKKYDIPYHPGALKYFKDNNIAAQDIK